MTGKEISQKIKHIIIRVSVCAWARVANEQNQKAETKNMQVLFFARAHRRIFVRTMMSNLSGHFECSENFVHNEKNVIVGHVLVALVRTQRIFARDWRWHCIGHALRHYPELMTRIWPETFQMHNELKLWRWQSRMALSSMQRPAQNIICIFCANQSAEALNQCSPIKIQSTTRRTRTTASVRSLGRVIHTFYIWMHKIKNDE